MQEPDPRTLYFLSGEVDDSSPGMLPTATIGQEARTALEKKSIEGPRSSGPTIGTKRDQSSSRVREVQDTP